LTTPARKQQLLGLQGMSELTVDSNDLHVLTIEGCTQHQTANASEPCMHESKEAREGRRGLIE
jgi:hypothetical protein